MHNHHHQSIGGGLAWTVRGEFNFLLQNLPPRSLSDTEEEGERRARTSHLVASYLLHCFPRTGGPVARVSSSCSSGGGAWKCSKAKRILEISRILFCFVYLVAGLARNYCLDLWCTFWSTLVVVLWPNFNSKTARDAQNETNQIQSGPRMSVSFHNHYFSLGPPAPRVVFSHREQHGTLAAFEVCNPIEGNINSRIAIN